MPYLAMPAAASGSPMDLSSAITWFSFIRPLKKTSALFDRLNSLLLLLEGWNNGMMEKWVPDKWGNALLAGISIWKKINRKIMFS
jgi:hypothetical protein